MPTHEPWLPRTRPRDLWCFLQKSEMLILWPTSPSPNVQSQEIQFILWYELLHKRVRYLPMYPGMDLAQIAHKIRASNYYLVAGSFLRCFFYGAFQKIHCLFMSLINSFYTHSCHWPSKFHFIRHVCGLYGPPPSLSLFSLVFVVINQKVCEWPKVSGQGFSPVWLKGPLDWELWATLVLYDTN